MSEARTGGTPARAGRAAAAARRAGRGGSRSVTKPITMTSQVTHTGQVANPAVKRLAARRSNGIAEGSSSSSYRQNTSYQPTAASSASTPSYPAMSTAKPAEAEGFSATAPGASSPGPTAPAAAATTAVALATRPDSSATYDENTSHVNGESRRVPSTTSPAAPDTSSAEVDPEVPTPSEVVPTPSDTGEETVAPQAHELAEGPQAHELAEASGPAADTAESTDAAHATDESESLAGTPAARAEDSPADEAVPGLHVTPVPAAPHPRVGRIVITQVTPVVDGGLWPAKAVVGEPVPITATVFREGHDAVAATAVLVGPDGTERARARMTCVNPGLDAYRVELAADVTGRCTFRVEGWSDPYASWEHDAVIKIDAGVDVELMLIEGTLVLRRALEVPGRDEEGATVLRDAIAGLSDTGRPAQARLAAGISPEVHAALDRCPLRDHLTASPAHRLLVQRDRALYSSWYEFFPRSEGARYDEATGRWVSGTLRTAQEALPRIAGMGFDVAYLTPIHPIGRINRKGANNSLLARHEDPGSPYAIGADEGGHDAIHPELGTFEDFDAFVARARECGLEVALDLALQCAPDHPWVREHPEWFTTRADGTIAYAENPPKKYQDIYPLNFDNDPAGIYAEILRVVLLWAEHGVTAFRVDNPHTKPVEFWEWLIGQVNERYPDVIFLAEAFTRPAMMHTLAKVGFHQSYTYFTWRTAGGELREYLQELTGDSAAYMRPNFWPTTHDILTPQMQNGGAAIFRSRAVLAATLSPSWGIYTGYELCENLARSGVEEQLDNEKYQFRPRDFAAAEEQGRSLAGYLRTLNQIRKAHPALHQLRGTVFHTSEDPDLLVYSRRFLPAANQSHLQEDLLIVVVNLDPHGARESTVHLDLPALGMDWSDSYVVHDLLSGAAHRWGAHNWVRLDPLVEPAHIFHARRL